MSISAAAHPVILVVDDEPLIRLNAVDMLEAEGFATLEASHAEDALALVDHHPEISVLFTDINMPGRFDGLELARRVHRRCPGIRLILTSGRRPLEAAEIPDEGRFLAKPYDTMALTEIVKAVWR